MFFFSFPLSRIYLETWARALIKLLVFEEVILSLFCFFTPETGTLCVFFSCFVLICCLWLYQLSCRYRVFVFFNGRVWIPTYNKSGALIDVVPYYWFFLLFLQLSPIQGKPNPISSWLNPIVFNKSLSCGFVIKICRVSPNVSNCCVSAGSKPVSLALFKINVLADTRLVFLFSSRPSQFFIWSFSTASDIVFKLIAF